MICYTTSIALLTSSLSPVYAVKDHQQAGEESSEKRHSPARLFISEEALQEKGKTSATTSQRGAAAFVKDQLSRMAHGIGSLVKNQDQEWDLQVDPVQYWRSHFTDEIEDLKTSPNKECLYSLQDLVGKRFLSAYECLRQA
ncbi:MAG TPA: hypothetical protein DDX01_07495, partial [Holosporales bacterium]|nr:hypothetical protein [Holosporales bacterium]